MSALDWTFQVAKRTCDAYSRDNYTTAGWYRIVERLAARGFSEVQTEAVMRSKWMRWASDSSGKPRGQVTSADFDRSFGKETPDTWEAWINS